MELTEAVLSLIIETYPGDFAVYRVLNGALLPYHVSPGLPALSGMSAEEYAAVTGSDAAAIVLDADRGHVAKRIAELLASGAAELKYRIRHKPNGFIWVHARARLLGSMDGVPYVITVFSGSSPDNTEETALLEHSNIDVYVVEKATHELLYISDGAVRSNMGPDYSGAVCYDYVAKMSHPCTICPIPELRDGFAHIDCCYFPNLHKWFRVDAKEMSWYDRDAVAIYAVDITEQEENRRFIEFDRQNLKGIVNNIPGGIGILHCEKGVICLDYSNDGCAAAQHNTREDWKKYAGENVMNVVCESDRQSITDEYERVRDDHSLTGNATFRVTGSDGGLHWVNVQFRYAQSRDGVDYYYATYTDLDKEMNAEARLRESQASLSESVSCSDIQYFTYFPRQHRAEIFSLTNRRPKMPRVWDDFPDSYIAYSQLSPADAKVYREMVRNMDAGADNAECTVRIKYDDAWLWERVRMTASRSACDAAPRVPAYSVDVTAQKAAGERLEDKRMHHSVSGRVLEVFSFNLTKNSQADLRHGDEIKYNEPVSEDVQRQAGEIAPPIGDPAAKTREVLLSVAGQIPDPDDRELFLSTCGGSALLSACDGGKYSSSIVYRRRVGDALRWVTTSVEVLPDPETGDLIAFYTTEDSNDSVVSRKLNEEIFTQNYETVAYYDLQKDEMHVKSSYDPADFELEGLDFTAAVTASVQSNVDAEDAGPLLEKFSLDRIRAELEKEPRVTIYITMTSRDEKLPSKPLRRIKTDLFYLDEHRDVLVLLLTDVTAIFEQERENREKMAAALAAAEQASVAKTEFLSRMSHEIRTPMNAIIGLDAIALQEKGLSSTMEDHLQKIGISARFLLSLINDILDMSRIESGRMMLKSEAFNFEELINGINTIMYEQCRDSGLDYDCVLKSFTEDTYVGDKTKLQQVLVNILGNAVKFTPKGGKVHFMIEQVSRTKEKARLRFEISDTGIGIDEKFLPHLFEAFSQENRGRTSAYGGTGLGLSISKNIVGLMGGDITVHSIKDVGSEFTVEVELGLSESSIRRHELLLDGKLQPLFTLIVDDDVIVCRHTQMILDEAGLKAEWVDSGAGAVAKVKEQRHLSADYDLILLDWKMPDMDGIETAREIRKIVGPEVTIIIMTAYDWTDIEKKAKAAGVDMFMRKPIFASSVTKAFENVFLRKKTDEEPEVKKQYDFTGKRVLLAEDNEINAEIARNILEMKGCEVELAENGAIAIEMFTSNASGYYDAILMDVRMPIMDGLEATKTIRAMKKESSKTIPIIAMTANAFQEDVNMSLESGMNAHLAKPIESKVLYDTLEHYINGR